MTATQTPHDSDDLAHYCRDVGLRARAASRRLATLGGGVKVSWLHRAAELLREGWTPIREANQRDVEQAQGKLTPAQIDRLTLTPDRLEAIARGLEEVARLPEPIGQVIHSAVRPNGLVINKVRVPLGVVFFIYESRPNVTADAAAICVKAGNAVILRGGKEAMHSSRALTDILCRAGEETGLPQDAVQLTSTIDRAAVGHFLGMADLIDVTIPRGGEALIRRVASEARMPVIKHFDGNCHVYVDESADLSQALAILVNAKCQRMGVCNAAESLVVHSRAAGQFLPEASRALEAAGVEIRGDDRVCQLVPGARPATEADYRTEFLGPTISACVVDSLDEAIEHINEYGSHHTDAIVTDSVAAAERFAAAVDSAAVMINASTRFSDGGEFGMGAEIGISTDKFHARGPCGVDELTSYKYVVHGSGQVRG